MKSFLNILIILVLITGTNACKSSQKSAEKSENEKVEITPGKGSVYREANGREERSEESIKEGITEEIQMEGNTKLNQETNYRLIVSFISWGAGVDPEARMKMNQCIMENQENTEKDIAFEDMPWGREGEVDFCFTLSELNEEEQINFVKSIKTAFEGNELVQIYENSPAMHKR